MGAVRQIRNEWFITFGERKKYGLIIGKIVKIEKGENFDVVCINVGKGYGEYYYRKLYVKGVSARKQMATLKRNNYTMVFVQLPHYSVKYKQGVEMIPMALSFWSAYTPTHFDRLDLEEEQKKDIEIVELSESEEIDFGNDFLSQFE